MNPTTLRAIVSTQLKMITQLRTFMGRALVLAAPVSGQRRFGVSLQPDARHLVSSRFTYKPYNIWSNAYLLSKGRSSSRSRQCRSKFLLPSSEDRDQTLSIVLDRAGASQYPRGPLSLADRSSKLRACSVMADASDVASVTCVEGYVEFTADDWHH